MPVYKNVSRTIVFYMALASNGQEDTSNTPTTQVSKDGAAFATTTNSASRIGATGYFSLTLTSTEMNCDVLAFRASNASSLTTNVILYPEADYSSTVAGRIDAAVSSRSSHTAADVWASTTRTLSSAGVAAIWDALLSGITTASTIGKLIKDNLDAAISTRSTYAGGDTSGTTTLLSRIGSALTITSGKVDVNDKTGFSLSSAGVQAIWDALTSALTTVGSIGKLLVDNINATISSRSTYAGTDTSGTTTLLSRLTSGRATNLDNLDAAVSTRSSHTAADVWASATRTLTSFGTLTTDTATAVWASGTRTLSSFGTLVADVATAVWAAGTRTLTAISDSSGITTLLASVGAWTGTGTNNILGALRAIASKTLTAPTDLTSGASFVASTDSLEAIRDRGDAAWTTGGGGGGGGTIYGSAGAIAFTYTVYDVNGTTPLPDCAVWVSSDLAGVYRSETKLTNAFGQVTFNLDASTVYFWRSRHDRTFSNPDTETVS